MLDGGVSTGIPGMLNVPNVAHMSVYTQKVKRSRIYERVTMLFVMFLSCDYIIKNSSVHTNCVEQVHVFHVISVSLPSLIVPGCLYTGEVEQTGRSEERHG